MAVSEPVGELDGRYSSAGATAMAWADARERLREAEIHWLATVRPDRRPHVTPVIAVWVDEALWFSTGPDEQKARNIAAHPACSLSTGCNLIGEGVDLVVEGRAVRETGDARLRRVAEAFEDKYGVVWRFAVRDGALHHVGPDRSIGEDAPPAWAFAVAPVTAFAFGRDGGYSQTRWRFGRG